MPEPPPSAHHRPKRLQADLVLLSASIIWGSAFVVQRVVASSSSVFLFNGLRFLLAGLVLLPFIWISRRHRPATLRPSHSAWLGVLLAGLLLTGGAALQQAGLRYTTAGNAGFITGLYVVLIPVIQAVILKRPLRPTIWVAALLATVGLYLLSTGGRLSLKVGDLLELAGTIFWALHVIWIGHLVSQMEGLLIAAGQYLTCGIASIGLGLLIEPGQAYGVFGAGWAILYTGIISVGLGYTLQIYGQKVAPPADAAILLSMEAVFAALFGWLFLNEALNAIQLFGCGIMLAGMLLAQVGAMTELSRVHS